MADLAEVEKALVTRLAAVFFPSTTYLPGAATASAAGMPVRVYRGWPVANKLDADLTDGRGTCHVSVFPEGGMTRRLVPYANDWIAPAPAVATLTAAIAGATLTFGGTGGAGQVVGIAYGTAARISAYAYRVLATDTPSTVAAALAAMVTGATAVGAVLTLPTTYPINALVVADTVGMREVRRQAQAFRVSCWAPSPQARDTISALADRAFASMTDPAGNLTRFITIAPGDAACITYDGTWTIDRTQTDRLWRRDIRITAEYGTTVAQAFPLMIFGSAGIQVRLGTSVALTDPGPGLVSGTVYLDTLGNVLTDAAGNLLGPPIT